MQGLVLQQKGIALLCCQPGNDIGVVPTHP